MGGIAGCGGIAFIFRILPKHPRTDPPPSPAPPAAATPNVPVATLVKPSREVDEVLKLTKAGVGEDVIVAYVKGSRSYFSLTANDILHLKDEGVSSAVVTAMLNHDHTLRSEGVIPSATPGTPGMQFPPPGQTVAPPPPLTEGATNTIQTPPLVPGGSSPPDGATPPPAQTEVMPAAPGADYYWAPGYWSWNGGWVWVGGIWYPRAWGLGWRGGWGYHGGWGGGGWHGGGGWNHHH